MDFNGGDQQTENLQPTTARWSAQQGKKKQRANTVCLQMACSQPGCVATSNPLRSIKNWVVVRPREEGRFGWRGSYAVAGATARGIQVPGTATRKRSLRGPWYGGSKGGGRRAEGQRRASGDRRPRADTSRCPGRSDGCRGRPQGGGPKFFNTLFHTKTDSIEPLVLHILVRGSPSNVGE